MSQRELSETSIEWITGVTARQARINMDGDTGIITLDGIAVLVNGVPVSAGFNYRGVWAAPTAYFIGDLVTGSDGDLYVAIAPSTGDDPLTTPASWTKVVDVPTFVDGVFTASNASAFPLVAQGFLAQSADLQQWQSSVGASLAWVDAAGNGHFPNIDLALAAVVLTDGDETASFPNSRELLAGSGINFDDTVANQRTINSGGLSPIVAHPNAGLTGSYVTYLTAPIVTGHAYTYALTAIVEGPTPVSTCSMRITNGAGNFVNIGTGQGAWSNDAAPTTAVIFANGGSSNPLSIVSASGANRGVLTIIGAIDGVTTGSFDVQLLAADGTVLQALSLTIVDC